MKHELPKLAYAYNALEPFIDERTMLIHHSKHHQTYVDNLNLALDKHPELYEKSLTELLSKPELIPADIKTAVLNHGGGVYNHNFFWTILGPNSSKAPKAKTDVAIKASFGTFEAFKEAFATAAKTRFGSGWAWLVVTPSNTLKVVSTPNQDVPFAEGKPILTLDVWEHAYYLNYQNLRAKFIEAFWNIVNWDRVEELLAAALKK
jgi:Fe-Mn family superoxide dismutase